MICPVDDIKDLLFILKGMEAIGRCEARKEPLSYLGFEKNVLGRMENIFEKIRISQKSSA